MSNAISSGVSKNLPSDIGQMVERIIMLSGGTESASNLAKLTPEQLITILSKLEQEERAKQEELFESNDQNKEQDSVSLAHLWKLVQKLRVSNKKPKFGSMDDKAREFQLIETARKMEQTSISANRKTNPTINLETLFSSNKHMTNAVITANQNVPSAGRGSSVK